jgi:FkbM family methyltransferase
MIQTYITNTNYGQFCLLKQDLISTHISIHKSWEPHLLYFYSQFIQPQYNIIDAGANIGFHTVQFGKLAKKGIVYSFEPQPVLFNILNINILLNDLSHVVRPLPFGLSNTKSQMKMSSTEEQIFNNDIINYGGRRLVEDGDGEQVQTMILDDLCSHNRINLIKFDIQGYELEALEGSSQIITENYPIIFIENYEIEPYVAKDKVVLAKLYNLGYSIYRIQAMNNEDCIALHPKYHKTEIDFINTQKAYTIENNHEKHFS